MISALFLYDSPSGGKRSSSADEHTSRDNERVIKKINLGKFESVQAPRILQECMGGSQRDNQ